jgi:hypothetical protein
VGDNFHPTSREHDITISRENNNSFSPRAYSLFSIFPGFTAVFTKWLEKSGYNGSLVKTTIGKNIVNQ